MSFLASKLMFGIPKHSVINQLSNAFRRVTISSSSAINSNLLLKNTKERVNLEKPQTNIIANVNKLVEKNDEGRLFAVVHLCGKQFKITTGDIIIVQGYWPPTIGDQIRLEKVLLAGAKDFTLIGKPLLQPGLIDVQATVIEKTLSHTKTHFKKKRRKQYMRINFYRSQHTMIRINSIQFNKTVDENQKNADEKIQIF